MKTVAACAEIAEAHLIRSVLEGHGIEAVIPDEQTAELVPHWVWGQGGVRVQVAEADLHQAKAVLAALQQDSSALFDSEA